MKKVKEILEKAGFVENRKVDIVNLLQWYENRGYHYTDNQKDFMEKYFGLEIHYLHPVWKEDVTIRINPVCAEDEITQDVVEEYNDFLNEELLIIGDIERENITVFLSNRGNFFGGVDDCIINFGKDFEKMLYSLIVGENREVKIID